MCSIKRINYNDIINIENLEIGLNHLKNKNFPALDALMSSSRSRSAKISPDLLKTLAKELKQQKYHPKPSRRIMLLKPEPRYIAIASTRDKIVQAAIVEKLKPVLEQHFLDCSFGFRPQRNCHDALKVIKYQWQNISWLIQIDFHKGFNKSQQQRLLDKLKEYCDQSTVELIAKFVKMGYIDIHNLNDRSRYQIENIPLASILSSLLCNLYYHDLDVFINKHYISTTNQLTHEPNQLIDKSPQDHRSNPNTLQNTYNPFVPFYYIRYADDILIGFRGTKTEAKSILDSIKKHQEEFQLDLNMDNSIISHSGDKGCLYLGIYIRFFQNGQNPSINKSQLRVPIQRLLDRAIENKHALIKPTGTVRATSNRILTNFPESSIVHYYSGIIKGILGYYSCVNQRSDLWPIVSLYRKACALTLADKLKLKTASKVFSKFGPNLRILNEKQVTQLYYPQSLKTKIDFKISNHHINEITLCINTHNSLHFPDKPSY